MRSPQAESVRAADAFCDWHRIISKKLNCLASRNKIFYLRQDLINLLLILSLCFSPLNLRRIFLLGDACLSLARNFLLTLIWRSSHVFREFSYFLHDCTRNFSLLFLNVTRRHFIDLVYLSFVFTLFSMIHCLLFDVSAG